MIQDRLPTIYFMPMEFRWRIYLIRRYWHNCHITLGIILLNNSNDLKCFCSLKVADALVSYDANKSAPNQLNPLSDSLQIHNRRIPLEEIEFLRRFETQDFSTNSPMLKKPLPPPEYLKLCALKVKHLVPLRENLVKKMMDKLTRCTEVHMDSYRTKTKESYSTMAKVNIFIWYSLT